MYLSSDWLPILPVAATLLGAAVAFRQEEAALSAEEPFREELFSRDQLVERFRELSRTQQVAPGEQRGQPLPQRVRVSARILERTYQSIAAAARAQEAIPPAAEWLLDNFHIVEEQLDDIRKHLPGRYYGELPKLASGPLAGFPRVYSLALELISHSDGALDEQTLRDAIAAYQERTPLRLGELWAVAIMLRVGLVENLRRLAAPLESQRLARKEADAWAERVIEAAANSPGELQVILGELAGNRSRLSEAFAVRLIQRLRGRGPVVEPVLQWLERHVGERTGLDLEEMVRRQNQRQAADQVSISNTITSFRLLDRLDWPEFVESASFVERVLRQDPAGVYSCSDFETRDACRHVVERLARRCRCTEVEAAEAALALAREGVRGEPSAPAELDGNGGGRYRSQPPAQVTAALRAAHVGYYLIDRGVRTLEARLRYRPGVREGIHRLVTRYPTGVYLGSILGVTLAALWAALGYAAQFTDSVVILVLAGLVLLLPAAEFAVALVNWLLTRYLPPRVVAKCDFRTGIPDDCRTLVAIPCLFTSEESVDELLERLEVHFLANQDRNLHFALLSDFADASGERMPEDVALLHRAVTGIVDLNARYEGENNYNRFFLFHRARRWNECQGCWMGWERKRGKLMELNRLLRGAEDTGYAVNIGDRTALEGCRYVITLDTDTQLPSEVARRLVGAMAHPLNRPVVDHRLRRVVQGYAVMQPRVTISLPSAARSLFTRIFSGNAGVDPYTTAVSDVYQDLFGEGIFTGKGIYEVDTFEEVLRDRVGENVLLSHDLFEGNFARCGLVTDIEFFDDYPARYNTWSARQHRWIRGDWQLLRWLLPRVPQGDGRAIRNPLSVISRWKILDNMRRSLTLPALVLFLLSGWLWLPGAPWAWTLLALAVIAFPIYTHLAGALFVDPRAVPLVSFLRKTYDDAITNLKATALTVTFMADQAWSSLDAIGRTLRRMFVTRRNLLEWTSAAVAEKRLGGDLSAYWERMRAAPVMAGVFLVLLLLLRREALPVALPFLFLWGASPYLAWWVSRPIRERPEPLTDAERARLRLTARKTWRYFEEFVTPEDNWLPPDNWQADREEPLAHRTSPTNIGLLLLSTLSARDLGYLGLQEMSERLERTLFTLAGMEKYCGHLYNWYDTRTAAPIPPYYISTVDSGNLAGHLLALKQGFNDIGNRPVFGPQTLLGLGDTAAALREALGDGARPLKAEFDALEMALQGNPASGPQWHAKIAEVRASVNALLERSGLRVQGSGTPLTPHPSPLTDPVFWATRLSHTVGELERDLETLIPWSRLLAVQPLPFGDGKPLVGDLHGRPHVFPELVSPPGGQPRGLAELGDAMDRSLAEVERLRADLEISSLPEGARGAAGEWLDRLQAAFEGCRDERVRLRLRLGKLIDLCNTLVAEMEFGFLYDWDRDLFAVGYDVAGARLDSYHYDLLASECRLASFIAIAKHEVPRKHWFRMGRALTGGGEDRALVSWSGTMFEYMMPVLVMRAYEGTLLAEMLPAVVRRQQRYAARERVPWGISESGFVARDAAMNYQYRAFGVPGLGLKPDLYEDLVVSPYSTILALPFAPKAAVRNLEELAREGMDGPYGFYEAVDFTPARLQRGQRSEVVRSLMAHHVGMSLVSIENYLLDKVMQERFHSDPLVKAAELLLQERNPWEATAAHPITQQTAAAQRLLRELPTSASRHYTTAQTSTPRVQLLSNGSYAVMLTNAGGGYSLWKDLAVTRWREDVTRDHWGAFLYLRDVESGDVWSAAHQPVGGTAEDYDVYFNDDKVEYHRRVNGIVSHLEVAVSPEDSVEVRRLTLSNSGAEEREIEIASYAEVVLARPAADLAHTTFSNLFVETEYLPERTALLATRRPRAEGQARVWGVHVLAHEGIPSEIWSETRFETDRARFLGRGRSPADPEALDGDAPEHGAVGPVLDPIFSLRQKVRIGPRQTVQLSFTTGAADSREEALRLAARYQDLRAAARTFDLAWTHSQVELRHLNLSGEDAQLYQRLGSRVLYVDSFVRPPEEELKLNTLQQNGLWAYGISGDLPIVLARVSSFDHMPLVRQLLVAHEYLRLKGLRFDLVFINEHPPSYLQSFEEALYTAARNEGASLDQNGGVFIRKAEQIPDAGRHLLHFVSRAVFNGEYGSLADQLDWRPEPKEPPLAFQALRNPRPGKPIRAAAPDLLFFNGLGGFTRDGREYVVHLEDGAWTPLPWINVVANPSFGFIATEAGSGFTWSENSRENRLTPWSNDPVTDGGGEAVYLRHEETGRVWSITPLPIREGNPYVVRHGPGYTVYEHTSHGVAQELLLFTPPEDPIKIYRVRLRNVSDRPQPLALTFYSELVLGVFREQNHPYVCTAMDSQTGAMIARNSYNQEFAHRFAFADVNRQRRTWTGDRTEFLGRNGSAELPRALLREHLSNTTGAGFDPCAALQTKLTLQPGAETEVIFVLGEGGSIEEVRELCRKYQKPAEVEDAFRRTCALWDGVLGAVQVETPDGAFDLLLNRWLLYQTLACRIWARSAFYQSGGAFGFRDQLQDSMACVFSRPEVTREQILLHASRQFVEGDVQHWWHPPTGRGIRTRFSDDLLWLPYVTAYYVHSTGDWSILDEHAPWLRGRPLAEGEDEYYDQPTTTEETDTLYEHCLRALARGMTRGEHGIPLMGSGDWNDGMNMVGNEGRGESVWVGWFLCAIIREFAPLCEARGEPERAARLREAAADYARANEEHAWDGAWYRRAYFDDGTPLGSAENEECQIDSLGQTWAIISGAGDPERARTAMESVEEYLIREQEELILLFTPAFDKSRLNPGYIKGYLPGVRENGGQYTHAALWTVLATAMQGRGDRAHQLFTLLNPVRHGDTPEAVEVYKAEPYVVAADVYGVHPLTGRGGWTWYTGSASWMYRVGLEGILGFRLHGDSFSLDPVIPRAWPGFRLTYRRGETVYRVEVENPQGVERGVQSVTLDGKTLADGRVPLQGDGKEHRVRVVMGRPG